MPAFPRIRIALWPVLAALLLLGVLQLVTQDTALTAPNSAVPGSQVHSGAGLGIALRTPQAPNAADASAYLSACNLNVSPGMTFTLDLRIRSGSNTVAAQQSYLTFTNSLLQVIPLGGSCGQLATSVQADLTAFEVSLQNTVNNSTGEIAYAAGTFGAGQPP